MAVELLLSFDYFPQSAGHWPPNLCYAECWEQSTKRMNDAELSIVQRKNKIDIHKKNISYIGRSTTQARRNLGAVPSPG